MAQKPLGSSSGDSSPNFLDPILDKLAEYGQNAKNNVSDAIDNMTLQSWIRLVIIVGGYMLLRPYLMKIVTKGAVKKMEEDDAREKAEQAKITPNEFRGVKEQLAAQAEDDEAGEASASDWGAKARVRQRAIVSAMLEAEERRRQEEEEDKDIADLLED